MDTTQSIECGIYRHYRGNFYEVLGVSRHSETLEELIVYKALYESEFGNEALWVRPVGMFFEEVEWQGLRVKRFMKVAGRGG